LFFTVLFRLPILIFMVCIRNIKQKTVMTEYLMSWMPFCESFSTIASTFSIGICLLVRVYNGHCKSLHQTDVWNCNFEVDAHALPQEHLVILMMYPLLHSVVFKALKFEYVIASWSIAIAFVFIAIGMADATQSIAAIMIYIPLSAILLVENYRQDMILYFVVKKQRKLLAENKQMSDETATELRHMIANVAHNLKTVKINSQYFILISF
jgi:hypothetical protein